MITRRIAKLAAGLLFAITLALPFAPAANAEELAPSPGVQIPITAVTPIQTCGNIVRLPGC